LFARFGSLVLEVTLAVWLRVVPAGAVALTVMVNVTVALAFGARLGFEQVRVDNVQVHPVAPVVKELAVVSVGRVSVSVTFVAVLGPAFFTICV
jgi:hypothetical protein